MRRPVLRPVSSITIHGNLALSASDLRLILALGVAAGPSQLVAEALVLGPVECGVLPRAVQRDPAPCAFVQGRRVTRLHPTRRVLALSDCPLSILRVSIEIGDLFLIN